MAVERDTTGAVMASDAESIRLATISALWADMPKEDQETMVERWYMKLKMRCAEIAMTGAAMSDEEWGRWNSELVAIKEGLAHV